MQRGGGWREASYQPESWDGNSEPHPSPHSDYQDWRNLGESNQQQQQRRSWEQTAEQRGLIPCAHCHTGYKTEGAFLRHPCVTGLQEYEESLRRSDAAARVRPELQSSGSSRLHERWLWDKRAWAERASQRSRYEWPGVETLAAPSHSFAAPSFQPLPSEREHRMNDEYGGGQPLSTPPRPPTPPDIYLPFNSTLQSQPDLRSSGGGPIRSHTGRRPHYVMPDYGQDLIPPPPRHTFRGWSQERMQPEPNPAPTLQSSTGSPAPTVAPPIRQTSSATQPLAAASPSHQSQESVRNPVEEVSPAAPLQMHINGRKYICYPTTQQDVDGRGEPGPARSLQPAVPASTIPEQQQQRQDYEEPMPQLEAMETIRNGSEENRESQKSSPEGRDAVDGTSTNTAPSSNDPTFPPGSAAPRPTYNPSFQSSSSPPLPATTQANQLSTTPSTSRLDPEEAISGHITSNEDRHYSLSLDWGHIRGCHQYHCIPSNLTYWAALNHQLVLLNIVPCFCPEQLAQQICISRSSSTTTTPIAPKTVNVESVASHVVAEAESELVSPVQEQQRQQQPRPHVTVSPTNPPSPGATPSAPQSSFVPPPVHPIRSFNLLEFVCRHFRIMLNVLVCDPKGHGRRLVSIIGSTNRNPKIVSLCFVSEESALLGTEEECMRKIPCRKKGARAPKTGGKSGSAGFDGDRWISVDDADAFLGLYPCPNHCGTLFDQASNVNKHLQSGHCLREVDSDGELGKLNSCRITYSQKECKPKQDLLTLFHDNGFTRVQASDLVPDGCLIFDLETFQKPSSDCGDAAKLLQCSDGDDEEQEEVGDDRQSLSPALNEQPRSPSTSEPLLTDSSSVAAATSTDGRAKASIAEHGKVKGKKTLIHFDHHVYSATNSWSIDGSRIESHLMFRPHYLNAYSFTWDLVGEWLRIALEQKRHMERRTLALRQQVERELKWRREENPNGYFTKRLTSLLNKLNHRCSTLTIAGWNNARFDNPCLIHHGLYKILLTLFGKESVSILRKDSALLCISAWNEEVGVGIRILDCMVFHGPSSLSVYLESHKSQLPQDCLTKGIFPFLVMQHCLDINGQDSRYQIGYSDFFNPIRGRNDLNYDFEVYSYLLEEYGEDSAGKSKALSLGGWKQAPQPGEQVFETMKAEWDKRGLNTAFKILSDYMRRDTEPLLLLTLIKRKLILEKTGKPMFENYVSVSSLMWDNLLSFTTKQGAKFYSLGKRITELIRSRGINGGYSWVSHRFVEKGMTVPPRRLRAPDQSEREKTVGAAFGREHEHVEPAETESGVQMERGEAIIQYDVNSLYPQAMRSAAMLSGRPVARLKSNKYIGCLDDDKRSNTAAQIFAYFAQELPAEIACEYSTGERYVTIASSGREELIQRIWDATIGEYRTRLREWRKRQRDEMKRVNRESAVAATAAAAVEQSRHQGSDSWETELSSSGENDSDIDGNETDEGSRSQHVSSHSTDRSTRRLPTRRRAWVEEEEEGDGEDGEAGEDRETVRTTDSSLSEQSRPSSSLASSPLPPARVVPLATPLLDSLRLRASSPPERMPLAYRLERDAAMVRSRKRRRLSRAAADKASGGEGSHCPQRSRRPRILSVSPPPASSADPASQQGAAASGSESGDGDQSESVEESGWSAEEEEEASDGDSGRGRRKPARSLPKCSFIDSECRVGEEREELEERRRRPAAGSDSDDDVSSPTSSPPVRRRKPPRHRQQPARESPQSEPARPPAADGKLPAPKPPRLGPSGGSPRYSPVWKHLVNKEERQRTDQGSSSGEAGAPSALTSLELLGSSTALPGETLADAGDQDVPSTANGPQIVDAVCRQLLFEQSVHVPHRLCGPDEGEEEEDMDVQGKEEGSAVVVGEDRVAAPAADDAAAVDDGDGDEQLKAAGKQQQRRPQQRALTGPADLDSSRGTILELNSCLANHDICPCPSNLCPNRRLLEHDPDAEFQRNYFGRSIGLVAAQDRFRKALISLDYIVKEVYVCKWDRLRGQEASHIASFCQGFRHSSSSFPLEQSFSEPEILAHIMEGRVNGLVQADISIPEEHRLEWASLPPIICKRMVSREHLREPFLSYAVYKGYLKQPRAYLTSGFDAVQMVITCSYLRELMHLAHARVTNVTQLIEFRPTTALAPFVNQCVEIRREADAQGNASMATFAKLAVNSSYGYTLLRRMGFYKTELGDLKRYRKVKRSNRFYSACEVGAPNKRDELFEIVRKPNSVCENLPVILGCAILNEAKAAVIRFYWQLNRYLRPGAWAVTGGDTDSMALFVSNANIHLLVRESMKEEWDRVKWTILTNEADPQSRREPGLWKQEAIGTSLVHISSKLYSLLDESEGGLHKMAARGINVKGNRLQMTHQAFKAALFRPLEFERHCKERGLVVVGRGRVLPEKDYALLLQAGDADGADDDDDDGERLREGQPDSLPNFAVGRELGVVEWNRLGKRLQGARQIADRMGAEILSWEREQERKRLRILERLRPCQIPADPLSLTNISIRRDDSYLLQTLSVNKSILDGMYSKRVLIGDGSRTIPLPDVTPADAMSSL